VGQLAKQQRSDLWVVPVAGELPFHQPILDIAQLHLATNNWQCRVLREISQLAVHSSLSRLICSHDVPVDCGVCHSTHREQHHKAPCDHLHLDWGVHVHHVADIVETGINAIQLAISLHFVILHHDSGRHMQNFIYQLAALSYQQQVARRQTVDPKHQHLGQHPELILFHSFLAARVCAELSLESWRLLGYDIKFRSDGCIQFLCQYRGMVCTWTHRGRQTIQNDFQKC